MANNYMHSCTQLPIPDALKDKAQAWVKDIEELLRFLCDEEYEEGDDYPLPGLAHAHAFVNRFYGGVKAAAYALCDAAHDVELTLESCPQGRCLYVSDKDGSLNVDLALQLISQFLEVMGSDEETFVEWCSTCDKSRPDAFGGGTALVSREHIADLDVQALLRLKMRSLRCAQDSKWAKHASSPFRAKSYLLTFVGDNGDETFSSMDLSEALEEAASGDLLLLVECPREEHLTPERTHALVKRADGYSDFFWPNGDAPPEGKVADVQADYGPLGEVS